MTTKQVRQKRENTKEDRKLKRYCAPTHSHEKKKKHAAFYPWTHLNLSIIYRNSLSTCKVINVKKKLKNRDRRLVLILQKMLR